MMKGITFLQIEITTTTVIINKYHWKRHGISTKRSDQKLKFIFN